MAMHSLIDYLPQHMRKYVELQKVTESEQVEIDDLWDALNIVWNNQFLFDCGENGVARWERMLEIQLKQTDTLDKRKFMIFTKLNQELPYTYTKLVETLTTLCGDAWYIVFEPNDYQIEIKLGVENHSNRSEVEGILNKMIPANMVTLITLLYNRHSTLHAFTHAHLASYTHYQLRNEVIS